MTGSSGYMAGVGEGLMLLLWLSLIGVVSLIVGLGFAVFWIVQHVRVAP